MRGVFATALAALLAVFFFSAPKPASALPAQAAINHSQANSNSDLVEVRKRYKKNKYYKKRYNRGRYYGPRYRGRYYGPRYRAGRYYGRRRGGVSIRW